MLRRDSYVLCSQLVYKGAILERLSSGCFSTLGLRSWESTECFKDISQQVSSTPSLLRRQRLGSSSQVGRKSLALLVFILEMEALVTQPRKL